MNLRDEIQSLLDAPAMNVDDRTELLGGMQQGAPAEVFAGIWGLAGSVLPPADRDDKQSRDIDHAADACGPWRIS